MENIAQLKVDTETPMPETIKGDGRYLARLCGLDRLDVGQSVLVPSAVAAHGAVRTHAYRMAGVLKRQFRTQKVDGGVRVWRVG